MKQHTPAESVIVQKIMRKLKPLCIIRKRHGSGFGTKGDPDLFGCLPLDHPEWPGRHFEIEVKRPGHRPTELQVTRLREWAHAGALTGVATCVEDAQRLLKLDIGKTLMEIFAEEEEKKGEQAMGRGLQL